MVPFPDKPRYTYDDLVAVLRILRGPDGCPWDRVQTHASDRRNFLEEAYEAAEAFDRDDPDAMCEELGDVLLQVLFNIHIEEDAGRFTTDDVTDHVVRKLLYRHPHVFGDARAEDADEVLVNWERLKRAEKGQQTVADTLDAVARSLPARWRAEKLLKRAGLDAPDAAVQL
ncbi:MAG: MazG family protein [Oscillospiraceae bacterium]|nr:MazG family protein [Oscillospiraceae bacterium]